MHVNAMKESLRCMNDDNPIKFLFDVIMSNLSDIRQFDVKDIYNTNDVVYKYDEDLGRHEVYVCNADGVTGTFNIINWGKGSTDSVTVNKIIKDLATVDQKIADLVDSSPEALNTLNELAAALGDDPNFATTITNTLATKATTTALNTHTAVAATTSVVGHVQLNSTTSSTSTTQAATASAVKTVNDSLTTHSADAVKHITAAERTAWNAKLDATANAVSASKLATARTISLTGDVTGSVTFDGSANASITTAVADDSHAHIISNVDGLQTALDGKAGTAVATTLANGLMSSTDKTKLDGVATGANNYTHPDTHPPSIIVQDTSNRFVTDAEKAAWTAKVDTSYVDTAVSGKLDATANAVSASKLATARTISLTGDVTGSVSFDGSGNAAIATAYKNSGVTAGTYKSVTVDAKGNVTAGTNPTTLSGYGITDAAPSSHVGATGGAHGIATTSVNGFLSSSDKTKLDGLLSTASATLPAAAGWYRVATSASGIARCSGRFEIDWTVSGSHGQVIMNAGVMYGADPTINQTHYSHMDAGGLTKARIVYHPTYSGNYAYLEVYNASASALVVTVQLFSSLGWSTVTPSTAGSIPTGYSSQEITFADGIVTEGILVSGIATGTAPLKVTSTTVVPNLNVDLLDGYHATTTSQANTIAVSDANNNITAAKFTGALAGNADTATKLATARTISLTGDVTGSVSFDGSGNAAIATTYKNSGVTAGTYKSVTVDAKGNITAGTNPTTLSGYGITDAAPSSHVGSGGTAHAAVTTTVNGFMSFGDKVKLDGIATGANNYSHPATHPPSIIAQDASNRFVTDAEKTAWNAKADTSYVDTAVAGIVDAAPATLDTLNELAAALGDDPNFATTVTNLIGTKLDATANAVSASKLATARTISLTGDVTGTVSFDGSGNASMTTAYKNSGVTAGTYKSVTVDAKGNVTAGTNPTTLSGYGITDAVSKSANTTLTGTLIDSVASGSIMVYNNPFAYTSEVGTVTGTMKITLPKTWSSTMMRMTIRGYNYDSKAAWELKLSGYNYSSTPAWSNFNAILDSTAPFSQVRLGHDGTKCCILLGTTSTTWSYPKIIIEEFTATFGSQTGWDTGWAIAPITDETGIGSIVTPVLNAGTSVETASKLATARTISLTGDVTGSVSFDGSGNASIATTYKNSGVTAGTYRSVTVDAKGNITAGTNPTTIADYGLTGVVAPIASPGFSGTPTAPTAAVGTNTTQIATTAFVNAEIANDAANKVHAHGNITSDGKIGTTADLAAYTTTGGTITVGTLPIVAGGTGATTAAAVLTNLGVTATAAELNYVDGVTSNIQTQLGTKAPIASPALSGTPTAPTAAVGTNTTQIATTAFVNAEIANDAAPIGHVGATGTAHGVVTTSVNGFMSFDDKVKLDSITAGANNYSHPATHPPSIIAQDTTNRFVTDAEKATWNGKLDSTGNAATATKLATARTISLTGSVTGSVSFDGSANASITTTTNHNHDSTYIKSTVANLTVSTTAPTTPSVNDIWIDIS